MIRVLLSIVVSDNVPQSKEPWMDVVKWVAEAKAESISDPAALEVLAELYQLSDAIISKAPKRLRNQCAADAKRIANNAQVLVSRLNRQNGDDGLTDSFREVAASLQEI
jgi:hypothetical protein